MNGSRVPEHVYANKGAGLKFSIDRAYDIECLYQQMRYRADALKKGEWYESGWTRENNVRVNMQPILAEGETNRDMYIGLRELEKSKRIEIVLDTYYPLDAGFSIPVRIHYPVAYAITTKVETRGSTYCLLEFYDERDNLVVSLRQTDGWEFRFRADRFPLVESQVIAKKKKDFDGGCLYCDKAVYEKENGVIYLKCTKYDGRVKETEYDGTDYPAYCKRR